MSLRPITLSIMLSLNWLNTGSAWAASGDGLPQARSLGTSPYGNLAARHRVIQWKAEQGLPQNNVTALLQTSDGYIWAGTMFGLVRYDGVRFTSFEKSTLPLMQDTDDHVLAMAEDGERTLWVCTRRGLLRLKDHQWTGYQTGGPVLGNWEPASVCRAAEGGVWVGVQGSSLLRFSNKGFLGEVKVPVEGLRPIRNILEDHEGTLWFGDRYHIIRRDPRTGVCKVLEDLTPFGGWVRYLHQDSAGRICYGGEHGARRITDGRVEWLLGDPPAAGRDAQNTYHDHLDQGSRTKWVARDLLLHELLVDPDGRQSVGEVLDHPGLKSVSHFMRDSEGNLWVGSTHDGLFFIQEKRLSTLQPSSDHHENEVWTVAGGDRGDIWFGTSVGVFSWHQGTLTHLPPLKPGELRLQVFSVLPSPDGGAWVGFGGVGLHYWNGTQWQLGPMGRVVSDAQGNGNVRAVYRDSEDTLWFGNRSGLHRLRGNRCEQVPLPLDKPFPDVRCITRDSGGRLWVGTYASGFVVGQEGSLKAYGKKDGLQDLQISAFLEDRHRGMWIGSSSGLVRFENGRLRALTRQQGMFDNVVNSVLQDDDGNLWVSCNRGIFRVAGRDAHAVLDGLQPTLTSMPLGESDGMASAETNGGNQPCGWKSPEGVLWFPTTKGVVRVDPREVRSNGRPPEVVIEQVRANGKVRFGDGLTEGSIQEESHPQPRLLPVPARPPGPAPVVKFEPGEAEVVEIRYTANSFEEPTKVRFQHRLEGHDKTWHDANDRRVTHYTNLDPGRYEFLIRACNNHGLWGSTVRGVALVVTPYFHQTWWFSTLCILTAVAIAGGVQSYRLGIQRRFLQLENQHALEKERARIAKDVHDDLGARMTQLGLLAELAESPAFQQQSGGAYRMPKVSALARDAVRSLDEIVWAVSPGKNTLDQLAGYLVQAAQDLLGPSGLRFHLQIPTHVPPLPLSAELRHNVFLVCKEAINNAVKHSGASGVGIEMSHTPRSALIIISDDGRGFHPSEAERLGNGLANMRKRSETVGASFNLTSGNGQGTRIEIRFPLAREP